MGAAIKLSKTRRSVCSHAPDILADIYQDDVNLAIWQRDNIDSLSLFVAGQLAKGETLNVTEEVSATDPLEALKENTALQSWGEALTKDIAQMIEMFGYLFEVENVGLRIRTLDKAMCPRFHIDRVPCRFITTYAGQATQWLEDSQVNRSKLGHGSNGLPDDKSGLLSSPDNIQQMGPGDIALLKGSAWAGNEDGAIVHRSPMIQPGEKRLLMTLDFM